MVRKGFNGGYRYRKLQVSGGERYSDEPEKNKYSHPHDALQYLLLGAGEYTTMGVKDVAEIEHAKTRVIEKNWRAGKSGGGKPRR
jgi:hypothetical protein